uniref:Uncharacterized protein n=1 Tax=Oryza glumipatula TaxID=40148 RepID=A0A0D9Y514_9ORYZ
MSTHTPLRRCHRRHKRQQPRCTAVKTLVGAAGGCHRTDKGLSTTSVAAPDPCLRHTCPALTCVSGLPQQLR